MNLEKALQMARLYAGSTGQKAGSRPVLKTALVTESYVIATNNHILIRIAHDTPIVEPHLHHYENEQDNLEGCMVTGDIEVTIFPVRGRQ